MIVRIVRLYINGDQVETAQKHISEVAPKVRAMAGCTHLEILRDVHKSAQFTTYSHWDSEAELNAYRHSKVFKAFWGQVKPLFSEPARAWSSRRLAFHF